MSPSHSLSSLPYEILLNCLSRVSRSDQPNLSIVSKSYRSLVGSPEIYKTRKLYGYTENYMYVCLRTPPDQKQPRWFILSNGKLSLIPSFSSQVEEGSSVVVLDWGIYVIGGLIDGKLTSRVICLDCRTHTWNQLPSMGVVRNSPVTGVIGGKIYVFGGGMLDSPNWAECFDPKTQTWVTLPPMGDRYMRGQYTHNSMVVKDEKVYGVDLVERTFYYSPSEGKWGRGSYSDEEEEEIRRDWCVIGEIIYTCDQFGNLCWCEIEHRQELMNWRNVQGLDSLKWKLNDSRLIHFDGKLEAIWMRGGQNEKLIDIYPGARLSNFGHNLVVFWDVIEGDHLDIWSEKDQLEIWCAEISLGRRNGTEIWGSIEWSHPIITFDTFSHCCKVLHSVCVTI